MNLSIENYIFLSYCVPLPLSALRIIEENQSHPFYSIKNLKKNEIYEELLEFNKKKNIIIRKPEEKANNAAELVRKSIFHTITQRIDKWNEVGLKLLPFFNKQFPIKLKKIKNPPKLIFLRGNYDINCKKAISIVGTRNPTDYGKEMAFKIARRFAELGFVIVNGFAKGVDIEAIKGGLDTGGKIVGVLGSGLLKPYPKENLELFKEILEEESGLFISEQLPDKNVVRSALASRNRISSGLSLGNVFIEASSTSGTKWQLKYSRAQEKPIIVLKPKENVKQTELINEIIKSDEEAYLIEGINDIERIADLITKLKRTKETSIKDFL